MNKKKKIDREHILTACIRRIHKLQARVNVCINQVVRASFISFPRRVYNIANELSSDWFARLSFKIIAVVKVFFFFLANQASDLLFNIWRTLELMRLFFGNSSLHQMFALLLHHQCYFSLRNRAIKFTILTNVLLCRRRAMESMKNLCISRNTFPRIEQNSRLIKRCTHAFQK